MKTVHLRVKYRRGGRSWCSLARLLRIRESTFCSRSRDRGGGSRRSRDPCEDEDRTKIQRRNLNMNGKIVRNLEHILLHHFANTNLHLGALHKEAGTARQIVT